MPQEAWRVCLLPGHIVPLPLLLLPPSPQGAPWLCPGCAQQPQAMEGVAGGQVSAPQRSPGTGHSEGPQAPRVNAGSRGPGGTLLSGLCGLSPGKSEGNGKMHITLCDLVSTWDSLTPTQKKSLNQRYQMGCECKVSNQAPHTSEGLQPPGRGGLHSEVLFPVLQGRRCADRKGSPASVFLQLGTKASPGSGNQGFPRSLHWGCIPSVPYRAGSAWQPCPELGGG